MRQKETSIHTKLSYSPSVTNIQEMAHLLHLQIKLIFKWQSVAPIPPTLYIMHRSELGDSRFLNRRGDHLNTHKVDQWAANIKPNSLQDSLEATIRLLQDFKSPLTCTHLIIEKLVDLKANAFTEVIKTIVDEVEVLCYNAFISNLKRVSEGKSIIATTVNPTADDIDEKNVYHGGMLLLNLLQRRSQQRDVTETFAVLKTGLERIHQEDPDVEENIELMKFFEGVRRYQDHQDGMAVQALNKLRSFKDSAIRTLALKKGFQLERFVRIINGGVNKQQKVLFDYQKRPRVLGRLERIFEDNHHSTLRTTMLRLKKEMDSPTLATLFQSYLQNHRKQLIQGTVSDLKRMYEKREVLRGRVLLFQAIFNKKKSCYGQAFIEILKSKPRSRIQRSINLFKKGSNAFLLYQKRKFFRRWTSKTSLRIGHLPSRLEKLFRSKMRHVVERIQSHLLANKKPELSDRVKGKVVASIMKVKQQDVNLKEAMLKWWLKSKPAMVEKNFMHMFLYAPTRPFTYFLRLKNMLKQRKSAKVNSKTLLFVMILKEKAQKFLSYKVKDSLQKWHSWSSLSKLVLKLGRNFGKWSSYHEAIQTRSAFNTMYELNQEESANRKLLLKVYNVIGGTGVGKIFKAIEVWKRLPNNKEIKKKQMMLKTINKGLERTRQEMRTSFAAFKECCQVGEEKKRAAALIMIRATGGSLQQAFKKWEDSMRIHKTLTKCRCLNSFLESATTMLTAQYGVVFENPRKAYLREKYLVRLVHTQSGNIQRYFNMWINAMKQARVNNLIQDKEKKLMIARLSAMLGSQSIMGVKGAVSRLYVNSKVKQKQLHFIRRLMQTKGGKLVGAIRLWKDLPEKNRKSKVRLGQRFFTVLRDLSDKSLIKSLKCFMQDLDNGQLRKRRAIGVLISMTSSDVRRYYCRWQNDTNREKVVNMCKGTINLVESLNQVIKGNMLTVLETQKSVALREKVMTRMVANLGGGVKQFLLRWHQTAKRLSMKYKVNELQRKHYISILQNGLCSKKESLIKKVVVALHKNLRIQKISRSFFSKLLDTKCGMTMKALQAWQSLPSRDINKKKQRAIKFQKKLQDLAEKGFRLCFAKFRGTYLEGESKQKYILNKLVNRCMNEEQKKYIHWKVITKELVLLDKAKLMAKTFDNIHMGIAIPLNDCLLGEVKRETNSKVKVITQLVANNLSAMQSALQIWKAWHLMIKTSERVRALNRLVEIQSGKILMREGFIRIKQEKELETQRTYINSLWRWKTSQFEAQYYNKFIQMFNESEVLLSFSKFFNSKLNSTYSWAFSKLNLSQHHQHLKHAFVKKYFSRKALSYLEMFRDRVRLREIQHWKMTFQGSIRGMVLLQALQKALRKVKSFELNNWNRIVKKYFRGKQALGFLQVLMNKRTKETLQFIKESNKTKSISKAMGLLQGFQAGNLRQSLRLVQRRGHLSKIALFLKEKVRHLSIIFMESLKENSNKQGSLQVGLRNFSQLFNKQTFKREKETFSHLKNYTKHVQLVNSLDRILSKTLSKRRKDVIDLLKQHLHDQKLLVRFKAAQQIYISYEKIWRKSVNRHFSKWKQARKESVWLERSIQMVATKPSIRSSLAISLWRLKMYKRREE